MPESLLSIVVPVHNDARNLAVCLAALRRIDLQPLELIVVDDASTEDVRSIAEEAGARYLHLPRQVLAGAARNAGWQVAQGKIVLFVDSDVVVPPDAPGRLLQRFAQSPDLAGVFGSYDDSPAVRSFYSQFRNLLHHYVHQNSRVEAWTFWAGFGALRRNALESSSGFDEKIHGIEDVELGMRLASSGAKLCLDKSLQVKHLKKWTLASSVRADIFLRAVPWTRLLLTARSIPPDLNLTYASRFSAILVGGLLVTLGLLAAVVLHFLSWPIVPLLIAAMLLKVSLLLLNRHFYAFLLRKRGLAFTCAAIAAHWLFYLYSGVTFVVVAITYYAQRLRRGR